MLVSEYGFFPQDVYDEIINAFSSFPVKKRQKRFEFGEKEFFLRDFDLEKKDGRQVLLYGRENCSKKIVVGVKDSFKILYELYLQWVSKNEGNRKRKFEVYLNDKIFGKNVRDMLQDTAVWKKIKKLYRDNQKIVPSNLLTRLSTPSSSSPNYLYFGQPDLPDSDSELEEATRTVITKKRRH